MTLGRSCLSVKFLSDVNSRTARPLSTGFAASLIGLAARVPRNTRSLESWEICRSKGGHQSSCTYAVVYT